MGLFEQLGGEEGIGRLVDAFYGHMAEAPEMAPLLAIHPDLDHARERLYEYLVGYTGGPPLYVSKHGHPRLRARHLHVKVDREGVALWLACMEHALRATIRDAEARQVLFSNLAPLAAHMRNTE